MFWKWQRNQSINQWILLFWIVFPFSYPIRWCFCANHIDSRNHQHQRRPGPDTFTPAMMIYGYNKWKNIMNLFITLLRGRRKMYRFFICFCVLVVFLPRLKAERFWVPTHAHVNESRKANGEQYSDIKIEDTNVVCARDFYDDFGRYLLKRNRERRVDLDTMVHLVMNAVLSPWWVMNEMRLFIYSLFDRENGLWWIGSFVDRVIRSEWKG